ncbi:hypothetical protein [Geobacillus zalihae]|uniref:hypothetical protein n=1 Tax=Geobacillus zalihae TaxID=213419 RepID=UPI0016816031|nr:hypothetical protein [Geobacillus zalihae]QNU26208.1 hypothetical protein IC806_08600 [Geobacillus zalihae]
MKMFIVPGNTNGIKDNLIMPASLNLSTKDGIHRMGMDDISPTNSNKNKLFTFFLSAIEALLYEKPCSTFTLAMTKNKMNDKKMYILKGILKMIAPTPNPISFAKFPTILIFTIPPNKRFSSSNIFSFQTSSDIRRREN